jgi:hypothetical protein
MANHLPGGEADDVGQVRLNGDGLVGLTASGFNGEMEFADRTEDNFTMAATLGSGAVTEGETSAEWED